jgi:hypothetical protein
VPRHGWVTPGKDGTGERPATFSILALRRGDDRDRARLADCTGNSSLRRLCPVPYRRKFSSLPRHVAPDLRDCRLVRRVTVQRIQLSIE